MTIGSNVRYDGSTCVNVRSVTSACRTLAAEKPGSESIGFNELSTILWFVEIAVTSRGLFFDGTVPRETTDRALGDIERLRRRYDLRLFEVMPIEFYDPRDILAAARDAFAESRLLIEHFTIDPNVDTPLEQSEHGNFVKHLALARAALSSARDDLALEWVSDAFRGSKCLAALIANGEAALESAARLYDRYDGEKSVVTSALINRFRLNYINQLASQKQSAYVPDPAFENVTRQHVVLFKDYLVDQVVKRLKVDPGDSNILLENMRAETPLPPIGLYALMATRAQNRPGAILETAFNEFRQDDQLMKVIWKNTKGGIALLRDGGAHPEYVSEIEAYFYDHYKTLEKEAEGIKVLTKKGRTSTYLIPAVLKGIAKAVPEAAGNTWIGKVLFSVLRETGAEASIPFLSDRLLGEGCDSYISQVQEPEMGFSE